MAAEPTAPPPSARPVFARLVVGIAGGSGAGKTTVARALASALGPGSVRIVAHDTYYRDHPKLDREERARFNYDHPDALETELLIEHLGSLRAGRAVELPLYDFALHRRLANRQRLEPAPVILVEGILVLADAGLRRALDLRVFVDADPDVRLLRRVQRDLTERGRDIASIEAQYRESVRPMHLEFVEPSRRFADLILPNDAANSAGIAVLLAHLRGALD
jgi:uridine kinase